MTVRKRLASAAVVAVMTWPGLAAACPACATRDAPGWTVLASVGAMIAVPYVVAAVALKIIRRLAKDS